MKKEKFMTNQRVFFLFIVFIAVLVGILVPIYSGKVFISNSNSVDCPDCPDCPDCYYLLDKDSLEK